ncbi:MAG: hypothetical protein K1W13_12315 [Lachnospiraceae bacterium]
MEGFNNAGIFPGEDMFWGLPVAFAANEDMKERIGSMSDEERTVLREKSKNVTSDREMDELVRMVAEGKFE